MEEAIFAGWFVMFGKLVFGASFLAFVGAGFGVMAWSPKTDRDLQVFDGRTAVRILPSFLETNGLKMKVAETAMRDFESAEEHFGVRLSKSTLTFVVVDGRFDHVTNGTIKHSGGFVIANGRRTLDASNFVIQPSRTKSDAYELVVGNGRSAFVAFDLTYARHSYMAEDKQITIGGMDMVLTDGGARALGRPELSGKLFGSVNIIADARPIDGLGDVAPPSGGLMPAAPAVLDIRISALSSLSYRGRLGTFPNGRNGFSMSTTSCNVGTQNIPWNAPMQTTHPVIAMNLYRVLNGRFEQIGWSWLKHGFLATNSNGCGSCQHPGTSALLGLNCSDTYGVTNNEDRFYLGDRDEVDPFNGTWTCLNSYFSDYQNDCVRRRPFSGEFSGDNVSHKLEVLDSDLGNAGATYYYEAYYISANDFNKYNNVSHRTATFSWTGSQWSVTNPGSSQTQGLALDNWGEMKSIAQPNNEGDVHVAVLTTNLGGGMWHYEFAVYNHDLDRQVDEFAIPVPVGTVVQNVGFRDIDQDGSNQWASNFSGGEIRWTTNNNPLKYSSVFNFRFDADVPPMASMASMSPFKSGGALPLAAATRGPLVLAPFTSYHLVSATQLSGDLSSLADRDGNSVVGTPSIVGSRVGSGLEASVIAPTGTFSSLTLGVVSKNSLLPSGSPQQLVQLWNWGTSTWVDVDTSTPTQSFQYRTIKLTSFSQYVNGTTREVKARVMHSSGLGADSYRWLFTVDQFGFKFE